MYTTVQTLHKSNQPRPWRKLRTAAAVKMMLKFYTPSSVILHCRPSEPSAYMLRLSPSLPVQSNS